ncbi:MAG: hypothetical protein GX316_08385 [Firmicutes bacterium]|nr:hypothetical protein [Bacillota bacterium]
MVHDKAEEVKRKMIEAMGLLKEAADLSISLVKTEGREQMKTLWEDFVREFIRYTKTKSRETGIDLISMVSMSRIFR